MASSSSISKSSSSDEGDDVALPGALFLLFTLFDAGFFGPGFLDSFFLDFFDIGIFDIGIFGITIFDTGILDSFFLDFFDIGIFNTGIFGIDTGIFGIETTPSLVFLVALCDVGFFSESGLLLFPLVRKVIIII
jgi:hypothetical protein